MTPTERQATPSSTVVSDLFTEVFQRMANAQEKPDLTVSFYPFAGINHTIRIRNRRIYVRLSDILFEAPHTVYEALARILVGKLFKKRARVQDERIYREYIQQPQILAASDRVRQQRGRKILTPAHGHHYDLEQLFFELNRHYFHDNLAKPKLSWSARPTKRILGHHDHLHDVIVISRSLDSKNVPRYVVEFVLYHEMLHLKHETQRVNGRRLVHPPKFRADERRFGAYQEALEWLETRLRQR